MSFHSPQMVYLNQSSTFDLQIPNFFPWSIMNRPIRVFIEDSESLTFCSMNDLFAWRLILTSSMQHLDLISWFKAFQKSMFLHQTNSESSDENSSDQKSQTLTFGQLFQDQTFSIIKTFQIIHHDHKKSRNVKKSTKCQSWNFSNT